MVELQKKAAAAKLEAPKVEIGACHRHAVLPHHPRLPGQGAQPTVHFPQQRDTLQPAERMAALRVVPVDRLLQSRPTGSRRLAR